MKTIRFLALAGVVALSVGCGNDTMLSSMGSEWGNSGNNSGEGECEHEGEGEGEEHPCELDHEAQAAALAALQASLCTECNAAEGTAEALFINITPDHYEGGPLEMAVVIGSPHGVFDELGALRLSPNVRVADVDMLVNVPATAWKTSEDGTKARIVLFLESGLPAGEYRAKGWVSEPAVAAFSEEEGGATEAFDDQTWYVGCPDAEEPGEGEGEGEGETPPPAEEDPV